MQKVQSTAVRFKVARAIELEPGFVLRPGVYTGIKTRTRVDSIGGLLGPSQDNCVHADQLPEWAPSKSPIWALAKNIDVTKFVRRGRRLSHDLFGTMRAPRSTLTRAAATPSAIKPTAARLDSLRRRRPCLAHSLSSCGAPK